MDWSNGSKFGISLEMGFRLEIYKMDEDLLTQNANNLSRFALKATQACLIQTGSQDRDHLNPDFSLLLEI